MSGISNNIDSGINSSQDVEVADSSVDDWKSGLGDVDVTTSEGRAEISKKLAEELDIPEDVARELVEEAWSGIGVGSLDDLLEEIIEILDIDDDNTVSSEESKRYETGYNNAGASSIQDTRAEDASLEEAVQGILTGELSETEKTDALKVLLGVDDEAIDMILETFFENGLDGVASEDIGEFVEFLQDADLEGSDEEITSGLRDGKVISEDE